MMADLEPTQPIRVLREPTVYLMGKQETNQAEVDRFLADHGVAWQTDTEIAGEHLVEVAGRLCYLSFAKPRPGGNKAYLDHILEVGHGSVLEHAVWNLLFTGVSRSLTHELIRHRAGFGFSQLSQRYVDESVAEYVVPDPIGKDPDGQAYDKRWLAKRQGVSIRDGQTGWIVIVQESYEGAIGHTLDTLKRSLLTSSLIACALIGVLLAVLWALAIRTWGEAARPSLRPAPVHQDPPP